VRCATHAINLLLKDIGGLPPIEKLIMTAHDAVKFITTHTHSLSLMKKHAQRGSKKALLKPGASSFAVAF